MLMKLSPQQVQYLKMLQLPTLALEQKIKAELEMNPLLEEGYEEEQETAAEDSQAEETQEGSAEDGKDTAEEESYTLEDFMNDDLSPSSLTPGIILHIPISWSNTFNLIRSRKCCSGPPKT